MERLHPVLEASALISLKINFLCRIDSSISSALISGLPLLKEFWLKAYFEDDQLRDLLEAITKGGRIERLSLHSSVMLGGGGAL